MEVLCGRWGGRWRDARFLKDADFVFCLCFCDGVVFLCNSISPLCSTGYIRKKRLAETKAGHEKTLFQRQIEATYKQIDRLVYELYGLTEDEIAIVEDAAR